MPTIMQKRIFVSITAAAILSFSCEHTAPIEEKRGLGALNVQSYVAIGNSITAGYQSSALYSSSQRYSYPSLIARQIGIAGGNLNFIQPLVKDPGVGGRRRISSLSPLTIVTDTSLDATSPSVYVDGSLPPVAYHNLGIPGAYVSNPYYGENDILDTVNSFTRSSTPFGPNNEKNLFYHLVRRNPANGLPGNPGSVWMQAKRHNPTLITVWIGNNDILIHAASGGVAPYTEPAVFQANFNAMMDSLESTGARILVATIPDVSAIAFMTTLQWFVPDPGDVSKPLFGGYISLSGQMGDGSVRPLRPGDLVLLTAADYLSAGYGLPTFIPGANGQPLPHSVVLDSAEVVRVRSITNQYNSVIRQRAKSNVAIVDIAERFAEIARRGLVINGVTFTTAYIRGGLFSLDGIHPTSQASGLIANMFLETMNRQWGASIPFVDVLSLPGIPIPLSKSATVLSALPYRRGDELRPFLQ
ncbi:MAG TPA: SGNH/GDSL hydrolase family protein [Bacteroidota bacterium]|nr:SGNH/GDSL hydrolase family protein [Bacteroidota bacterium]